MRCLLAYFVAEMNFWRLAELQCWIDGLMLHLSEFIGGGSFVRRLYVRQLIKYYQILDRLR